MLQADGGTRTAAITGAWVALHDALAWMRMRSMIGESVLADHVAAISCGLVAGAPTLDLDYAEDSSAGTDANFVMTGSGGIVEIQGTAEGAPFSEEDFSRLLQLARTRHRAAHRPAEARRALRADDDPPGARPDRGGEPQRGKVREIVDLLGPFGIAVKSAAELGLAEPEETGTTFEANAILKAKAAAEASGLVGARRRFRPRGRCARRRARHLFGALGRTDEGFFASPCERSKTSCRRRRATRRRSAARISSAVLALATPDGEVETFAGRVDGTLVWPPRGDQGFGYDPIFLPDGHSRTFGEMSAEEKHGWRPDRREALSHRARAFQLFARALSRRRPMSAADRRAGERDRLRHLRALAVLRGEVPLLRLQQPRPPSAAGRGALFRRARRASSRISPR